MHQLLLLGLDPLLPVKPPYVVRLGELLLLRADDEDEELIVYGLWALPLFKPVIVLPL